MEKLVAEEKGRRTHTNTHMHARTQSCEAAVESGNKLSSCSDTPDIRRTCWNVKLHSHTHTDVLVHDIIGKCCNSCILQYVILLAVHLLVYSVVTIWNKKDPKQAPTWRTIVNSNITHLSGNLFGLCSQKRNLWLYFLLYSHV